MVKHTTLELNISAIEEKLIKLKDLEVKQCFKLPKNEEVDYGIIEIFMKIDSEPLAECLDVPEIKTVTAVSLTLGDLRSIEEEDEVVPINVIGSAYLA